MLFSLTIEHFCCPLFTNKKNNMRANVTNDHFEDKEGHFVSSEFMSVHSS